MPEPQNKPTQEELKAKEEEAIALAEELEKNPPKEEDEPDEVVETPVEEAKEEEEAPIEEEEQAVPSKEILKKKLSASARENQRIYAKNRVINKALTEADDIPEPTEEELQREFTDWDVMSDTEKTFAKETIISRNWRKVIANAKDQASKIEKWTESVDTFVEDPKSLLDNPDLEGKTNEFREFALIEANNSVPFNILVSAFLHESSKNKTTNKGRMFERGKGGSNEKPENKSGTITLDQARQLRETDYNKYKEYLTAGKIVSDL